MVARIAIPEPTSSNLEYNNRALPQYLHALHAAGAIPVPVALHESQATVARLLSHCNGVLLPGSPADLNPQKYGEKAIPECAASDPQREAVDELLLQDAFNLRKPILAICYGTQALNVWRNGSLVQHLATDVNHKPGREVKQAHPVTIAGGSLLESIAARCEDFHEPKALVNSSHHQAIASPGDGLRVVARTEADGVIEAVELDPAGRGHGVRSGQFVLGVQWHPERTYESSAVSRAIFRALRTAAEVWRSQENSVTAAVSLEK